MKAMTPAKCYKVVGQWNGMKPRQVKAAVEGVLAFAADQLNKNGSFNVAGMLILKLKMKPAKPARSGVDPFTKAHRVFQAKPAAKIVRARPTNKFMADLNKWVPEWEDDESIDTTDSAMFAR